MWVTARLNLFAFAHELAKPQDFPTEMRFAP